ncbi:PDDEXK nuclease domain-containing protein [Pseudomonas fluorescens]|uniref:PDDEXK nuclease domain-containing protein n=2 Tax=Bacteria TaxID=2 RepID=UPI00125499A9|nr:PDDEXK nuclease domain-containing protein [Pseudomonas fluorescens]VVO39706.1 hypothetical protein PS720_05696 [Pseudomonas fluorescens]
MTNSSPISLTDPPGGYTDWLAELKARIHYAQQRAVQVVNRELVLLYWQIGRDILVRQRREGWGAKVIDRLAHDLRTAFPDMKGFSRANLMYMRAFAEAWPDAEIVQQAVGHLPWGHNLVLLAKLKDPQQRQAYAQRAVEYGWSRSILGMHIETRLLEREGKAQTNFAIQLPAPGSDMAQQTLKDPYVFDFLDVAREANEREIEHALVQHVTRFLLELGAGFAFVGRQVPLEVGGDDFFIDLLFYHLKLRCYVVIELKADKFKPEHLGQLGFYLTAVDVQMKSEHDAPTIGLLLCKSKNKVVAEYALRDSAKPMGVAEYQLVESLPAELKTTLPSIEQIEHELAESLKGLIKGKPVLIDAQKAVFESALSAANGASAEAPKVLIIEGGPGTGKTDLAINLLVRLIELGFSSKYVSKNAAPRRLYESKLVGTVNRSHLSKLFSGSGAFIDTEPNTFDTIIVDDAHRLNEKSGLYGNLGENQITELIESAKCSIFFIDEDQRVTLNDIGSKQAIRAFAKAKGASMEEYILSSQFRCSGSDGYLARLDDVLGIHATANPLLDTSEYEFKVFDSPQAMHAAIEQKNHGNKARVVAGYCWPWLSKKDPKAADIVIGDDYARQWNLDQDGSLWIIAENSIEQVGCIHTCQGMEVDYIGVIIGPDLIVRDGQVVTSPHERDKHDKSIRGWKKLMKEQPLLAQQETDRIIKNTYRTLMTRGMKGCYLYCTDQETAQYFTSRLAEYSND